jgi:ribose transport system permease protein
MSVVDDLVTRQTARPPWRARLRATKYRDLGIVGAFLALFLALAIASPAFLTSSNLLNLLDQWAPVGIIACAGTLVIISGGFDLSVGAIYALAGIVAAKLATDVGVAAGLIGAVLTGVACGAANGFVVAGLRIHSFMATLASSMILRGVALALSGGFLVTVSDPSFATLGQDKLLGLKLSVWIWVAFAGVTAFLLTRTRFGHHVFAAGGNADAARLSGVRVGLVRGITFTISGLAAGIAGLLVVSRSSTGQADIGTGLELTAIAAIVVGGTSILGGEGAIWRTLLGVLLLAMIGNGFNLLHIDPIYQQIVQGGIILTAVAVDAWSRRR